MDECYGTGQTKQEQTAAYRAMVITDNHNQMQVRKMIS